MNDFEECAYIGAEESDVLRIECRHVDNRGLKLMKPYIAFKIGDSCWWPVSDLISAADSLKKRLSVDD